MGVEYRLPEPVIPYRLYSAFIDVAGKTQHCARKLCRTASVYRSDEASTRARRAKLGEVLSHLPRTHCAFLSVVLPFLQTLAKHTQNSGTTKQVGRQRHTAHACL